MRGSTLWGRVLLAVLVAALPPVVAVVVAISTIEGPVLTESAGLVLLVAGLGTIGWAAVLAIVYSRSLVDDYRALVAIARRGEASDAEPGTAFEQLAALLDERNRQVASLAEQASAIPIDALPRTVGAALVSAVRVVMRDATWRLAILASPDDGLLPPGIYHGTEDDRDPDPIDDLERWASVEAASAPARLAEGPWGAFVVVTVAEGDRLRGVLHAPWEGRAAPTPAELDLLRLVGEHAGTAIEHSVLYAEVRRQADTLDRLATVQADFLRGVTHDLQTPLTRIGALATEIRADAGLSPETRADLETISHQADRLRRMVSQLLVASRLEAGVITPRIDVFAVAPIVERTWEAMREDRPFEFRVDGTPHLAVGDPDRLEQVLWAVLDNAVKYSPPGSPIAVRVAPREDELTIAVRDEGSGMDPETRDRAFDQFFRADQARRDAPDGSGVGLYAARGLVEAMGGTMAIDSRLGAGTSVTISLPAEPV